MALSKSDKESIVKEVKEVASNASSLVISDARGLKVSELSQVRKEATQSGIHIQVIKNSLAKLAFEGTDFGCSDEVLVGVRNISIEFGTWSADPTAGGGQTLTANSMSKVNISTSSSTTLL